MIITGSETYESKSNTIKLIASSIFVICVIIGILPKNDFWGMTTIGIGLGAIVLFLGNLLYLLTPMYRKKRTKADEIYTFFKKRFNVLKNFDEHIHKKIDEHNFAVSKNYDETMFNVYMMAFKLNADAIIMDRTNDNNINCVFVSKIV